ncbi:hypothetical protein WKV44_02430 [Spirochaetia bacterium 38H-sp]|uniref:Thioredoxin domain-containing protein n=1 Tax=Rarispira pelagica TaxID=3141764 RepID=A0ABU9U9P8_9SPIR
MFREITEEEALNIIKNKELTDDLLNNENTVFIATQQWCPQWSAMLKYLPDIVKNNDNLAVLWFCYDTSSIFESFMVFKETVWKNALIPYVRYYRNKKLYAQSNYVSEHTFYDIINKGGL